jgi:hypothetical protein
MTFAAVLLVACGITLSEGEAETEVFKDITIEGDFRPDGELEMIVSYEQPYTASLDVQCDLIATIEPTAGPEPTANEGEPEDASPTLAPIPQVIATPKNRLFLILLTAIDPNPEGGIVGEATPTTGTFQRSFHAPEEPGRYTVRCHTPIDQNNSISETFEVSAD